MAWFVYSAGVFGCSLWFVRRCFVVTSFVGCFLVWFGWVLFSGLLGFVTSATGGLGFVLFWLFYYSS